MNRIVSTAARPRSFREGWVTAQNGVRIYYRDYGGPDLPGTPVLCLAGLTRNSKDFHAVGKRLMGGRRVIAMDYRGRGRSGYDSDWRNYRPEVYVNDIRHLLCALGVHKVAVIGTSLGGLLAAAMTVAMPGMVKGVVINDVGPDLDHDGIGNIVEYLSDTKPYPDWDTAVRHMREAFPGLPAYSDEDWLKITQGTYIEGHDGLLHPDWDTAIVKVLQQPGGTTPDLWPFFRNLGRVPSLLLRGETSDVLSRETFEHLGEAVPGLMRMEVPNVGHCPSMAEPEVVIAIDALLAKT